VRRVRNQPHHLKAIAVDCQRDRQLIAVDRKFSRRRQGQQAFSGESPAGRRVEAAPHQRQEHLLLIQLLRDAIHCEPHGATPRFHPGAAEVARGDDPLSPDGGAHDLQVLGGEVVGGPCAVDDVVRPRVGVNEYVVAHEPIQIPPQILQRTLAGEQRGCQCEGADGHGEDSQQLGEFPRTEPSAYHGREAYGLGQRAVALQRPCRRLWISGEFCHL